MDNEPAQSAGEPAWAGRRVLLVGKLAGLGKRATGQLLRERSAQLAAHFDPQVDVIVLAEDAISGQELEFLAAQAGPAARNAVEQGRAELLSEPRFWQRLGLVEPDTSVQRLYTPALLASLLGLKRGTIRTWQLRGLLQPLREIRRLSYFDFQEVMTAKRLAEWQAAGASPAEMVRHYEALRRAFPHVERPLAQLPVVIQGKRLLLREAEGLVEPGGQKVFDFDETPATDAALTSPARPPSAEQFADFARGHEEEGLWSEAAQAYRAALAASGGLRADWHFALAECLYRAGDLPAARERFFMAVELDEDYVEARANLGCLLAELGEPDLALAAFQGALHSHPNYPDAHYHLAHMLEDLSRADEAREHWEAFLRLAPDSPWADEARERLAAAP